ncbi:hypothetical protein [Desulfovibrio sp. JC022]|uniref:hypothetical protein n=1 Tax=Desulfovibrio sp. JC022 TaxID=2593642 RepID=UPI0013D78E1E|nr:hypothetical protein [Desulfovibrio sp. JC022]NDV22236.1 hypothetical protein [Desulfovibrio sp. JC022]
MNKFLRAAFCFFILPLLCSGCLWGTAAVVGVAVLGANVNEFQESQKPRNATQALDEHLEQKRKEDEAISRSSEFPPDPIDSEEIIEFYSNPVMEK